MTFLCAPGVKELIVRCHDILTILFLFLLRCRFCSDSLGKKSLMMAASNKSLISVCLCFFYLCLMLLRKKLYEIVQRLVSLGVNLDC